MPVHQKIPSGVTDFSTAGKKKLFAFGGFVLAVSFPVALIIFLRAEIIPQPLSIGEPVPRVELVSLVDQSSIVLGNATKQAVLFFTVECPYCQQEMFNFEILSRRYQGRIQFIAVSLSDPAKTENLLREKGFSFPVALDEHKKAKDEYRIVSVPALLLIDGKGILRHRRFGAASIAVADELFQKFLQESASMSAR
jgi:peroxiredoxin